MKLFVVSVFFLVVLLRLAEAVLACPGFEEYAAYLPELVSCVVIDHGRAVLSLIMVEVWVFRVIWDRQPVSCYSGLSCCFT
jgi:hypothetical protein